MAYDDVKVFEGEPYAGMRVGGRHTWRYTDAVWRERKVSPDAWDFVLTSVTRRDRAAPEGSGVPLGTQYHWYVLAHQWVRKIDADSYRTFMSGVKHKVAHRRPAWRTWSSGRLGRPSESETLARILTSALDAVRTKDGGAESLVVDV
ncbi:MAG: hypothetical protein ACT4OI_03830 [Methanobacteriota archaeon]